MKMRLIGVLVALVLVLTFAMPVLGDTTADVTVTATPAFVSITDNQTSYDFGVVAASSTPNTAEDWCAITNDSTVQTDSTISVTTATWAGGVTWAHAEDAVPGADTAGLKANRDGTWGVGDIIVKNAAPNFIYENAAAGVDFAYGLQLIAPTSFTDGVEKSITVRVTIAAG